MATRVCIIGAGAGGLAAIKAFKESKDRKYEISCFECKTRVGGVWNTEPSDDEFSSAVYNGLRTNLPHELMQYFDMPFPPSTPLFPNADAVFDYLQDYATTFNLIPLIRFNTKVTHVSRLDKNWSVTVESFSDRIIQSTELFDVIVVANGHFNVPYIPPQFPGLSYFKGSISHAKTFRRPDEFHSKRVCVVGASFSGLDISREVSTVSTVYLSAKEEIQPSDSRVNCVPQISRICQDGSIELMNGDRLVDIDAIIFATGYSYNYPFLSELCGENTHSSKRLVTDGQAVHNLYKGIFYIPQPSLCFIGLQVKVDPFPLSQLQARVIESVVSSNFKLPNEMEMRDFETKELERIKSMYAKDDRMLKECPDEKLRLVMARKGVEWQYAYWDQLSEMLGHGERVPLDRIIRRSKVSEERRQFLGY